MTLAGLAGQPLQQGRPWAVLWKLHSVGSQPCTRCQIPYLVQWYISKYSALASTCDCDTILEKSSRESPLTPSVYARYPRPLFSAQLKKDISTCTSELSWLIPTKKCTTGTHTPDNYHHHQNSTESEGRWRYFSKLHQKKRPTPIKRLHDLFKMVSDEWYRTSRIIRYAVPATPNTREKDLLKL